MVLMPSLRCSGLCVSLSPRSRALPIMSIWESDSRVICAQNHSYIPVGSLNLSLGSQSLRSRPPTTLANYACDVVRYGGTDAIYPRHPRPYSRHTSSIIIMQFFPAIAQHQIAPDVSSVGSPSSRDRTDSIVQLRLRIIYAAASSTKPKFYRFKWSRIHYKCNFSLFRSPGDPASVDGCASSTCSRTSTTLFDAILSVPNAS